MKKFIAILVLAFVFITTSHSAVLEDYYSGAWYDTRVATFRVRGAGELRIWTYDDKTAHVEFYYNGVLIQTATGTWANTRNLFKKTFIAVAQGGQIMRGTLNTFSGFSAGSYKGGGDTGKWQVITPP